MFVSILFRGAPCLFSGVVVGSKTTGQRQVQSCKHVPGGVRGAWCFPLYTTAVCIRVHSSRCEFSLHTPYNRIGYFLHLSIAAAAEREKERAFNLKTRSEINTVTACWFNNVVYVQQHNNPRLAVYIISSDDGVSCKKLLVRPSGGNGICGQSISIFDHHNNKQWWVRTCSAEQQHYTAPSAAPAPAVPLLFIRIIIIGNLVFVSQVCQFARESNGVDAEDRAQRGEGQKAGQRPEGGGSSVGRVPSVPSKDCFCCTSYGVWTMLPGAVARVVCAVALDFSLAVVTLDYRQYMCGEIVIFRIFDSCIICPVIHTAAIYMWYYTSSWYSRPHLHLSTL